MDHVLFTDADKDRPDVICDRNGQVVLGLCKICGKGESQLEEPCTPEEEAHTVGPVAWVDVVDTHEGPYNFNGIKLLPKGHHDIGGEVMT